MLLTGRMTLEAVRHDAGSASTQRRRGPRASTLGGTRLASQKQRAMAKLRVVSASVPRGSDGRLTLEARRQVLMDLIHAEVSEATRRVRALWNDHADGWEVELKELDDPRASRPWWRLW